MTAVSGDLAVAPDGTAMAVETEFIGGVARVRPHAGGFGPFLDLSPADEIVSSGATAVVSPVVAVGGGGTAVIAYRQGTTCRISGTPAAGTRARRAAPTPR